MNSTNNYTLSTTSGGLIGGATGIAKSGTGTLTVTTANTFTGPTIVSGGTLALNNNLALQNSVLTTSTNSVTLGGGITTPTLGGLSGSTSLFVFVTNGYSSITELILNVSAGTNVTYSGPITNSTMSLTKTGAGTQVLSGQSTYTGATAIKNGTVVIGGGNDRLPQTTTLTLGNGADSGVLQLGDSGSSRNQSLANLLTSGSGTANAVVGGNSSISTLTLTNTGDVTLTAALGGAGPNQNNRPWPRSIQAYSRLPMPTATPVTPPSAPPPRSRLALSASATTMRWARLALCLSASPAAGSNLWTESPSAAR